MAKKNKKTRIFSALEVANICGVVNQTTINWIKNGYLKAFVTPGGQYRVYAEDFINFLKSRDMRIPDELLEYWEEELNWNTILIVDDEKDLNDIIMRYLKKKIPDYSILQAFDGFEAGSLITEKKPGIIILDINLPGINGHKLCKKIKEDVNSRTPIIIAITGLNDPKEKDKILESGADAFFAKPLNLKELFKKIQELELLARGSDGEKKQESNINS